MALSTGICAEVRTTGNDGNAGLFRGGSALAVPSAPSVSTSASGGTVAAGTYYVVVTVFDEYGETGKSAETPITTTGTTSTITVTAPSGTYDSWAYYIGTTSGGPYFSVAQDQSPGVNAVRTTTPATSGTQPPGVDYSNQAAAQFSYTDLVIGNPTTTNLTSAARPFTPDDVGNVLNITAGVGFTTGRYEITGVTSGVATVDRSVGTAGRTGGTAAYGGAFATPGSAAAAAGSTACAGMWIGNGNYDFSASSNVSSGCVTWSASGSGTGRTTSWVRGYHTTRGDDTGTRPVLRPSANSVTLITNTGALGVRVENLEYAPNGFTGCIGINNSGSDGLIRNNKFNGVAQPFILSGAGNVFEFNEVLNWTTASQVNTNQGQSIRYNRFSGTASVAAIATSTAGGSQIIENLFYQTTTASILSISSNSRSYLVSGNTFYAPTSSAANLIQMGPLCMVQNNVVYANTSAAVIGSNPVADSTGTTVRGNAVYNAGSGAAVDPRVGRQSGNVTLTGDPFVNAAGGDYSLNNTAGQAAKGIAYPTSYPGLASPTSSGDAGAYQAAAAASSGGKFWPRRLR